jgi:hypothetical protein
MPHKKNGKLVQVVYILYSKHKKCEILLFIYHLFVTQNKNM